MTLRSLPIITAALLLAGCGTEPKWSGEAPNMMVRPVQRIIDVEVPAPARGGYLPQDLAGLREALRLAASAGSVRVEVLAPTQALHDSISQAVRGLGVPAARVNGRIVPDLPGAGAIVLITSTQVQGPDCAAPTPTQGQWSFSELPDLPLGCAAATNFARMVAEPEDLIRKSAPGPGNTEPFTDAIDRQRARVITDPNSKEAGEGGNSGAEAGGTTGGGV